MLGPQIESFVKRVLDTGAALSNVALNAPSGAARFLGSFFPAAQAGEPVTQSACAGMMLFSLSARGAETGERARGAPKPGEGHDRVLAHVSHELRTPLMPVFLTLAGLIEDQATPAEVRRQLLEVRAQLRLQTMLIDDLNDSIRIRHNKLILQYAPVCMHELVADALEICRAAFDDAGLEVTVDLSAGESRVCGDRRRLLQVVWNLLQNAAKFTPRGGAVRIRSSNWPAPGAEAHDRRVRIEIRDNGAGIEPARLPRIFDDFEQGCQSSYPTSAHLGLGLSIARAITESHGGTVTAHSDGRGKGAAFTLELPVLGSPSAAFDHPSGAFSAGR